MKVAVVGSGVSGLAATWLLNEHSDHVVHLFEADNRPGGHANTVDFSYQKGRSVPVDTGFIVLNPATYPNFLRFLKLKSVALLETEMTFSVSRDRGKFEWAGGNLFTVFCQPTRLLDPQLWCLLYDVLRFNACARQLLLDNHQDQDLSISRYLEANGYSASFRDNYLIPMTAAVWSTSPNKCDLGFPARTLVQFMHNHHLLQITGKPSWLTIYEGSKVYVDKIVKPLAKDHLHLATPVVSVKSLPSGKLELKTSNGGVDIFDHVILACHSDTALDILRAGGITSEEEHILSMFTWNQNEAILHSDIQLMPQSRLAWSCWNYLSSSTVDKSGRSEANIDQVSLTYWMNDLQHISMKDHGPILVTLNPPLGPTKDTIVGRWAYDHPVLDANSVAAQSEMSKIQNKRGISFAGAYLRYGFHEDGFTSGLRAAVEHLGSIPPFDIKDPDRRVNHVWLAHLFSVIEATGARTLAGLFFSCLLYILRLPIGLVVDLSHLDN